MRNNAGGLRGRTQASSTGRTILRLGWLGAIGRAGALTLAAVLAGMLGIASALPLAVVLTLAGVRGQVCRRTLGHEEDAGAGRSGSRELSHPVERTVR